MTKLPYNIGPATITIYGAQGPVTGARTPEAIAAIKAGDFARALDLLSPVTRLVRSGAGELTLENGVIRYKGRVVNNGSTARILDLLDAGLPVESELRCLASLMRHDDPRVIESFEDFLDTWKIPRVSDGRIVLCKGVREDFKDQHSGTVDWSPGLTVSMPWDAVDRDPNNTCSAGLHAAPLEGARTYASGGGHLLELYVWPEHIAALPYDYKHNGKVRLVQAYVSRVIPRDIAARYYDLAPLVYEGEGQGAALGNENHKGQPRQANGRFAPKA